MINCGLVIFLNFFIFGIFQSVDFCFGFELTENVTFDNQQPVIAQNIIQIEKRHSKLLNFDKILKRVSIADETIADVLIVSPYQIYINGKTIGNTNLTVWNESDKVIATYMVKVCYDLKRLKQTIDKILPNEKIEVYELEGSIILSGTVSSYHALKKAKAIAIAYTGAQKQEKTETTMTSNVLGLAKQQTDTEHSDNIDAFYGGEKEDYMTKGQVVVLLEVAGQDQVMLKLCFAEVNTYAIKEFNTNLHTVIKDNPSWDNGLFYTLFDNMTTLPDKEGVVNYSSNMTGSFRFSQNGSHFRAYIELLKNNGLAKILAEPNLVCISGKKGSFVVGGEFPVPVPGKDSTTIEWKQYGVLLNFKAEVLSDGKIWLEVAPVVSELDFSSSLTLGGFQIPGLTTRQAKTELVLQNDHEFTIAGLIKHDLKEDIKKYPILGDIPILGALFRSKDFQNRKTDLVIIVRPSIVKDTNTNTKQNRLLPESFDIPSDFKFLLESNLSDKNKQDNKTAP